MKIPSRSITRIPPLAWDMVPRSGEIVGFLGRLIGRLWVPTIVGLFIIHGAAFYYTPLGLAGAGPVSSPALRSPRFTSGNKQGKR